MTKYIYYPHLCLLIYTQDNWKEKEKKRIKEEIISKFLTLDKVGVWGNYDVSSWDEITLFDPMNPEHDESRGPFGVVHVCEICKSLYSVFLKKKGKNDGLTLLSHSRVTNTGIAALVEYLLENPRIKKIYMLQLEEIKTTGKISLDMISEILEKLTLQQRKLTGFSQIVTDDLIDPYTIYEITKESYY